MLQFVEANEGDLNRMLEIYNYYIEAMSATFDLTRISLQEFRDRIFVNHEKYKRSSSARTMKYMDFAF